MKKLSNFEMVGKMVFTDNLPSSEIAEKLNLPLATVHGYKSGYKKKYNITVEKESNYEKAIKMLKDGLSIEEVAEKLEVKPITVKKYIPRYRNEMGIVRKKKTDEVDIEEIKKEWDVARFRLNPNARRES